MKYHSIVIAIFLSLLLSNCGIKKTPLTEDQIVYAGKWVSNDGTWIHIYNDGAGSLKSGNTSVEGGKTTISENEIKIGVLGINKTYKIDVKPYEEEGKMKMKLNGFIYERAH